MDNLKTFNTVNLLHFTENDRILSAQLLEMSVTDMPSFFEKALKSFSANQFTDSSRWIHKIKGVAATVGADLIHDKSCTLELKLKSDTPPAEEEYRSLGNSIESFCCDPDVAAWISDV